MGKAASAGIKTMTAAMMANPILAALVALLGVIVAVQQAWSYFTQRQKEAQARMDETTAALNKQNRALELIARKSEESLKDKQLDNEKAIQDLKRKHMRELAEAHAAMNEADIAALRERQELERKNLETQQNNTAAVNRTLEDVKNEKAAIEEENKKIEGGTLQYKEGYFENDAIDSVTGERWQGIWDVTNQKDPKKAKRQYEEEKQQKVHDNKLKLQALTEAENDLKRQGEVLQNSLVEMSSEEKQQYENAIKQIQNSKAKQEELNAEKRKNQNNKVVVDGNVFTRAAYYDSEGNKLGAKKYAALGIAEVHNQDVFDDFEKSKSAKDTEITKQIEAEAEKLEQA
jgi:hypothetical protein